MIGCVELVADKARKQPFDPAGAVGTYCFERCQEHGLIIRNLGDQMAFCPPLIMDEAGLDQMLERFGRALDETTQWVGSQHLAAE